MSISIQHTISDHQHWLEIEFYNKEESDLAHLTLSNKYGATLIKMTLSGNRHCIDISRFKEDEIIVNIDAGNEMIMKQILKAESHFMK